LQQLSHDDADLRERCHGWRQAGEPHPDLCALRPMPHHGHLLGLLGDGHAPGRDELPLVSRSDGRSVRQRHHGHEPGQPHPDRDARLQRFRLPLDRQRQPRWLPYRHGEHHCADAHRRWPHHDRWCRWRERLPDLSPIPPRATRARTARSMAITRRAATAAAATRRRRPSRATSPAVASRRTTSRPPPPAPSATPRASTRPTR